MNVAGHDTNLALGRLDDTRAVGSNQSCLVLSLENRFHSDHIESRNALSDTYNQFDLGLDSLLDRVGSEGSGHVDDRRLAASVLLGLAHSAEHWKIQVGRPGLPVVNTAHHLGSVGDGLLGVEGTVLTRDTLADDAGVLVYEDFGLLTCLVHSSLGKLCQSIALCFSVV